MKPLEGGLHSIPRPRSIHTILLDMDGVITSESCYWDAARLTVLEVLGHSRCISWAAVGFDLQSPLETLLERSHRLLSPETIAQIKARAINTNWDVAYLMASLYLIRICSWMAPESREQIAEKIAESEWPGRVLPSFHYLFPNRSEVPEGSELWSTFADFLGDRRGFSALQALNAYWQTRTGLGSEPFQRGKGFWKLCQDLFQAWYLGEDLYQKIYGRPVADPGKEGLIYRERPLLPSPRVRGVLSHLRLQGFTLGIATGRPYPEIVTPLEQMGLLPFFDSERIATHREVEAGEAELRKAGLEGQLSKPHPFLFLRALYPSLSAPDIWAGRYSIEGHADVAVVGDAVSDALAAKAIGCYSISVLTGTGGRDQAEALQRAGTDLIIPDVTYLPRIF